MLFAKACLRRYSAPFALTGVGLFAVRLGPIYSPFQLFHWMRAHDVVHELTATVSGTTWMNGLFDPFLDLVEGLGWRVSAICQLWASDVDRSISVVAPHGRIRKRGEVDKEAVEMVRPRNEKSLQGHEL